jgi:hypothetical protein
MAGDGRTPKLMGRKHVQMMHSFELSFSLRSTLLCARLGFREIKDTEYK